MHLVQLSTEVPCKNVAVTFSELNKNYFYYPIFHTLICILLTYVHMFGAVVMLLATKIAPTLSTLTVTGSLLENFILDHDNDSFYSLQQCYSFSFQAGYHHASLHFWWWQDSYISDIQNESTYNSPANMVSSIVAAVKTHPNGSNFNPKFSSYDASREKPPSSCYPLPLIVLKKCWQDQVLNVCQYKAASWLWTKIVFGLH